MKALVGVVLIVVGVVIVFLAGTASFEGGVRADATQAAGDVEPAMVGLAVAGLVAFLWGAWLLFRVYESAMQSGKRDSQRNR